MEHSIYSTAWGIYARKSFVRNLDPKATTTVFYAFFNLNADGAVILGDPWADTDIHSMGQPWDETKKLLYGQLGELFALKLANPHILTAISIGGWSWSNLFTSVLKDPVKLATFVSTTKAHVENFGFDIVDVDWEFPGFAGLTSAFDVANDANTMLAMCKALTAAGLKVSLALSADVKKLAYIQPTRLIPYVSRFNLMTYDFEGSWSTNASGVHCNLFGSSGLGGFSGSAAVDFMLKAGVLASTIHLGYPSYARASGPFAAGDWSTPGFFDYKGTLLSSYGTPVVDTARVVATVQSNGTTISFDTPETIALKCAYVKSKGLGGLFCWEQSSDYPTSDPRSLFRAVSQNLPLFNTARAKLSFPKSIYANVNSVVVPNPTQTIPNPKPTVPNPTNPKPTLIVLDSGALVTQKTVVGRLVETVPTSTQAVSTQLVFELPTDITKVPMNVPVSIIMRRVFK